MQAQAYICPYCFDDHYSGFACAESTINEPITQEEIDFIRPRIKENGWYYGDHDADEIANNAIDDLGVCLQRIDELEAQLKKP